MKRGFLNDKTKKPKPPVAPVQVHSSQKVFAHPRTYVIAYMYVYGPTPSFICAYTDCRYDTPGASPQADDEFKCTMMPPPPPHPLLFQQSGPYSLCVFQGRLQELAILSTPGFPCAIPSSTPTKYRVVNPDPDSANGGAGPGGMFASCKINTGDLVVAERPLFLIPAVAFGVPLNMPPGLQASSAQVMQLQMRQYNMLLEKCLDRLSDEDKQAFYAFKTHGRKEGLGPILDRMEMNALSVVINSADGKEKFKNAAIFKLVSRINHKYGNTST